MLVANLAIRLSNQKRSICTYFTLLVLKGPIQEIEVLEEYNESNSFLFIFCYEIYIFHNWKKEKGNFWN